MASIDPIFTQHSRSWRDNLYVYPVISRRAKGLSIGVNLNPDKVCNFDCVYCCVDRTIAPTTRTVDLEILKGELDHMLAMSLGGVLFNSPPFDQTPVSLRRLNDVAFSGDGEPTAYPKFPQACEMAAELLAQHRARDAKIVVITNATLLHRPAVQKALAFLDAHNGEIWAKLDAGTEAYYQSIERSGIEFGRVLENIRMAGQARPIVIQSLFLEYRGEGPSGDEIAAYVTRLKELLAGGCRVKLVQIYTVARATAEVQCRPVEARELDRISTEVRKGTGLPVETFYG